MWIVLGLVALAAIALWASAAGDEGAEAPPPSLVGVWTTDDPRYEDRALEVTADALIFRTGGTSLSYHTLLSVETTREPSRTAFTLRYRGGYFTVYVPHDDPDRLTIQNRPAAIWRRGAMDS